MRDKKEATASPDGLKSLAARTASVHTERVWTIANTTAT